MDNIQFISFCLITNLLIFSQFGVSFVVGYIYNFVAFFSSKQHSYWISLFSNLIHVCCSFVNLICLLFLLLSFLLFVLMECFFLFFTYRLTTVSQNFFVYFALSIIMEQHAINSEVLLLREYWLHCFNRVFIIYTHTYI